MKVADLFVDIAVKGGDDSTKSLKGVREGMTGVVDSSLAAKAAIIGAVYALERFSMSVASKGAGLVEYQEATGNSMKALQQWQLELLKFNVTGDNVQSTLRGISKMMGDIELNGTPPKWFTQFSQFTKLDFNRAKSDSAYVLEKMRELSHMNIRPEILRNIMAGLGINDQMLAGLKQSTGDVSKLSPQFSEATAFKLSRIQGQWALMWRKIDTEMGQLVAKHGPSAIKDIDKMAVSLIHLVSAMDSLAQKLHVFEGISKAFEGWEKIFTGLSHVVDALSGKEVKGQLSAREQLMDFFKGLSQPTDIFVDPKTGEKFDVISPGVKGAPSSQKHSNNNIKTDVHIHTDAKDPREHGRLSAREINAAVQQSNALVQVS